MRKKQSVARRGWAMLGLLALFLLGMGQPVYAKPDWSESAPYIHFVNYHYVGNGVEGGARDVIMEYSPDANGIFQISVLEGTSSNCYIYQIRQDGLYELAHFDTYSDVEDKRTTDAAKDDKQALILPADLTVGKVYYTGYDKSVKNTVVANPMTYVINGKRYENTVKVSRELPNGTIYLYYAPKAGLIAVEDQAGNPEFVLTETYGNVGNTR